MNLTEKKKLKLLQIEKARTILSVDLSVGLITEVDIIDLLKVGTDYGFKPKNKSRSYKNAVLKSIFNAPFVLCDQELSISFKKLLPIFLNARYNIELDELNKLYKDGYLTEYEYKEEKELLLFCYYKSSEDGKSILKTGHVDNVLDNKIRVK